MPRKKGKFIDKKKAVSFRLVHRSQRDPLAADADAPQHVLQPLDGAGTADPDERRKAQVKSGIFYEDNYDYMQHLRTVEEYHNVHLSEPIHAPTEPQLPDLDDEDPEGLRLFRKTSRGFVPIVKEDEESAKTKSKSTEENLVRVGEGELRLPASAFASHKEEKVGLVNQGASNSQPRGPLIGWDPDIVEALDEDFDLDDPENLLDDNFVLKANQDGQFGESEEDDDSEGDWTSEDDSDDYYEEAKGMDVVTTRFGNATNLNAAAGGALTLTTGEQVGDLKARIEEMKRSMAKDASRRGMEEDDFGLGFGDFDDLEETKSRFTEYSMTSSVIRRNDQLTLLDDRFENLYKQYDDDQIGGLDGEELGSGGGGNVYKIINAKSAAVDDNEKFDDGPNPFNDILLEFEKQNTKLTANEVLEKLRDMETIKKDDEDDSAEEEEEDNEEVLVRLTTFEKPREKNNWDCESIISTYSNLYNHPKKISEPSKKKSKKMDDEDASSVSSRTINNEKIKLSAKSGLPIGVLPAVGLTQKQLEAMDYDGLSRLRTAPTLRPEDETGEERRARKKAVKEERRERRMEKKANTTAFKDEEKKQKKTLTELQTNIQGIKIH